VGLCDWLQYQGGVSPYRYHLDLVQSNFTDQDQRATVKPRSHQ